MPFKGQFTPGQSQTELFLKNCIISAVTLVVKLKTYVVPVVQKQITVAQNSPPGQHRRQNYIWGISCHQIMAPEGTQEQD